MSLNFKHLRYFWTVAKAGSVARAARLLHLTPHAISAQLATLETSLGTSLFHRVGRRLELTEAGQRILGHADEIFALGDRIVELMRDENLNIAQPFRIGIADSMPKSVVYRLIEPALQLDAAPRLICREGRLEGLLGELAVHRLDIVLADRPLPPGVSVRGYSHLLGDSPLSVFASPALAATLPGSFPASLDRAPFLLPGEDVAHRPALLQWLERMDVHPRIVAEFDDGALMKAFGQAGAGLFVAPTAIAAYICEQYKVIELGKIDKVREQIYAITTERKLTHPAMLAIRQRAREAIP
ncbi:LysR family transcriptional regulator [Azoarcus sp. L1K30]|uniref:LysR family transcriptional regulator n=1 Tax=Azoarcus sp. L1K30 TaxID=2820277 RepID=UPI001B827B56|nr:LysR family transcriptional regulator [Azoarcus sp. L1K30]MBR0567050.1 LysR family transcriptional regulator [Azoarcus sp. L1K30]